jgi:hypothetical protein
MGISYPSDGPISGNPVNSTLYKKTASAFSALVKIVNTGRKLGVETFCAD